MKKTRLLGILTTLTMLSPIVPAITSCSCDSDDTVIKVLNTDFNGGTDGYFVLNIQIPDHTLVTGISIEGDGASFRHFTGSGIYSRTPQFYWKSIIVGTGLQKTDAFCIDTSKIPNGQDLQFKIHAYYGGQREDSHTSTITIHSHSSSFFTDSWSEVITYANQGIDKLKEHYGIQYFDGLQRKIKLNGLEHIVRVIGQDHDTIAGSSSKAALTFDLYNVVTKSDDVAATVQWNSGTDTDYTTSILRQALNSTTEVSEFGKSCLTLLKEENPELASGLKTVTKNAENGDYNDVLFPLTANEMFISTPPPAISLGTSYSFYKASDWDLRYKGPVSQTATDKVAYWVQCEYDHDILNPRAMILHSKTELLWGHFSPANISENQALSFAFCI